ncbi:LOW QUALITY PROTEIN: intermembrane lipid transfer protein VPS13C [Antechinus flavipes]|uniref:LOW QUALITY PROTEIN: intermembrane lipid transfer protein VPS13C n=1 Tax=Antechinus flavipes TaxID=38775 RepID=UPI00223656A3|nr:LOW QUALITY PROTEIN: intermembrane lipid transfer protein VPS13C [Antechinus flavipes]
MVLESVVADLFNRFLGDYVENLDKSQLKLGIWGGNVALDNLQIKENALSELDVPFKVKAGQIDKLILKIPWKNLYGEAVVATLEGLYLLVVPGASIKYDAGKEEKYLQEIKQRDLSRIEEALQKAAEKGVHSGEFIYGLENFVYKDIKPGRKRKKHKKYFKKPFKGLDRSKDKPKKEKKDTFLEKLATQVIKNVQVKITDIHIKYEDDVTDPKRPLSLGVTLGELSLLTANENWTPCILNEAAKIIYKLVCLDSLSAYWNVNCNTCYRGSKEQILDHLKSGIPSSISSSSSGSPNYQYIFRPISASAKLYMNPHAETELKTPKLDCNIEVQNIAIELTKPQYLSMIDLLESLDYMVRNAPYRKYRPCLPLHTNSQQWWKYAIDAILEVHIRRSTRMWSWNNIKKHRQSLKCYKNVYKNKLTQNKVTEEVQNEIQELEKNLDVFNIVLARQQAQAEVIRSGQKLRKKSADTGEKRSGGWFSGFWGKKETKKKDDEESLVPETIDDLMTPEEKAKLFTAIGYSESTHNLILPKQYIAHVMTLKLLSTSITIREYKNVPEILKVQIIGLSTRASQRPGAQALRVEAKLEHWYITGLMQQNIVPSLVASIGDTSSSLLNIEFETNPEDSTADQTLVVQSQPVEIIYDAKTINAMVEFFQASKSLDLEQITTTTLMKLEEIKEKTATGLTHIIETRKVLDLRINLKPSYLIVPRTGFHHEKSDILVLDFGTFQLNSIGQGERKTTTSSLEEIMDKAYDKFDVEIKSVQCLFGRSGEDWKKARFQHPSSLHILQPMDIHVELAKAMVDKDIRMARFKVSGGLPLMHVRLSDQKMKNVLDLIHSIPLPTRSDVPSPERKVATMPIISHETKRLLNTSMLLEEVESESDDEYFDAEDGVQPTSRSIKASEMSKVTEPPNEELIDLQLKFEIKEVILELTKQQEKEDTILVFNVMQLGTEATVRPFDIAIISYLKKISLDYHEIQGTRKKPLHLISSSDKSGLDLLKVEYIKADKNGPSFQTNFENTEQTFKVAFSSLNLLLQTQALLSSINYLTTVIPSEDQTIAETESQLHSEKQLKNITLKKATVSSKDNDIFNFKLFAKLNAFCVTVCDEKHNIAEIKIQGLDSSLSLQSKKQSLFARLENIIVTDVDTNTIHKQVVSIMGNEVFRFNLDLYPDATEGDAYADMSKVDGVVSLNVGCIQIVYLHKFLMSLLNFLNNFHMAKEALSAATAQAAEKAATSVKDLAQRSFRAAISIDLKAPVIIIPQSSISSNAVVVDLGLIRIQNKFSQVSGEDCLLPPVIDKMVVQLTKLKLSRTVIQPGVFHPDIQLLHPINLNILVNRNLASAWYHKIPIMEITGHLDAMNIGLNQDDLSLLLRILEENLGEAAEGLDKIEPRIQEKSKGAINIKIIFPFPTSTPKSIIVIITIFMFINCTTKKPGGRFTSQQGLRMSQEILPTRVEEIVPEDVTNVLLKFEIKEVLVTLMKKSEKKVKPLHELNVLQLGVETKVKTHVMTAKMYLKKINMKSHDFKDSEGEPLCIINSCNVTDEPLLKMEFIKANSDGPEFKTVHNSTKQTVKVSFSSLDLVLHLESLLSIMDFMSSAIPSQGLPTNQKGYEMKLPIEDLKSTTVKAVSDISHQDVFDLKITAKLNAFNVFVCDQKCNIADIKVQGMDASISVQSKKTEVFARLRDIIVTNADPVSIHKKAVSIVGDEVFRFQMTLYPDATEGKAYTDMSKVDGKLSLKVGCIQIVYLHKFFMSLLNFLNNFQKAKEAVSTATAQAAEKAASSMKDFAQKSFRLSVDINLKAPVIIIPQSSVSSNAVLADLGLIRVENKFNLVPVEPCNLPPVVDKMNIQLTQLKLSRIILQVGSSIPDIEILQPVNMCWSIQRNLAAEWYTEIPGMKIKGNLKPMQIALSEEDLTILMKILMENLGEGALQPTSIQPVSPEDSRVKKGKSQDDADHVRGSDFDTPEQDMKTLKPSDIQNVSLQFDFHFESLSLVLYNNDINQGSTLSFHSDHLRLGEFRLHLMTSEGQMFNDGSLNIYLKLQTCTLDDLREGVEKATSRMIDKKNGQDKNSMININYKQDKNGSQIDAVLDKLFICASVEFLMTVADFFIKAIPQSSTPSTEKTTQISLRQTTSAKTKPERGWYDFFYQKKKKKKKRKIMDKQIRLVSPIILNTVMTIMAAMSRKKKEDDSKSTSSSTENLWAIKSIDDCNAWFLGVDMATEITETFKDFEHLSIKENFVMVVKSVQVTFECGLGHRTIPLLLIESTFSGTFKNWSSLMAATADMTLEIHYYNEIHAVWEPLIERVEGNRQWNLKLELKNNPVQDKSLMPGDDFIFLPEPQTAIHISSKDTMNITISKCCLTVFNNLSKVLQPCSLLMEKREHVSGEQNIELLVEEFIIKVSPIILNTVMTIMAAMSRKKKEDDSKSTSSSTENLWAIKSIDDCNAWFLGVDMATEITETFKDFEHLSIKENFVMVVKSVQVTFECGLGHRTIPLLLIESTFSGTFKNWSSLMAATADMTLEIKNHFSIPFTVYKFVKTAKLLEPIGTAKPEEEFHVPLDSYRCQLFIQPTGILKGQFKESTTYISWKEELHRSNEVRCILQCPSTESNFLPLIVNTVAVPDELSYISTHGEDWNPAYIIHLYPSLILRNLLPYSLRYLLEGTADTHELSEGSTADVLYSRINGEIMELVLMKYQGKNWNGHFRIQDTLPEFFLVCFTSDSTEVMTVDLSIHVRRIGSRMILSVFSPYWLINKTSRVLQYRAEDIHVKHPADYRDIILFSFKKKNIFSKNKVQLRISTSIWSSSFSLDTVGSYGCVKCPANNMEYLVGVSIKMSSFNLTRIVTLTPFFTIANKSSMELEVGEIAPDGSLPTNKWNYIASSECLPFWPENLSGKLCVRVVGCEGSSKPFFYNQQDNGTLLSLEELNGGILVDVNIAEHSTVITFSDYHEGSAPALIINQTPWDILQYKQNGSQEEMVLLPRQVRLFAWADPTGTKKLTWRYAENVGEHDLLKDECGQFPYDANIQIHWVSFLDGRQRVLLFTDDVALVSKARQAEEMEQADQEINVSLHSLGLSLVNNENKQEISYIGITSSDVVWEMKPKRKWKPFSQKNIIILEQAYQKYLQSNEHEWIKLDSNFEVNFSRSPMEMRVPFRCHIKRDFLPGIHVEFKQSPHQRSLRAQLYWIQVDNQLPGSMFPVAFHPVAPPKSIALDSEPRPFIDISIITRFNEYSKVLQFKYFMVLIQEMALKIDQGFLGAVLALFTPATDPEAERKRTKLIQQDIDTLNTELLETSMTDISSLSFFEHFHISPIKLHLSLSLGSGGEESDKEKQEMIALHSVNLLLKSIGATLTDVDDLIFKLAYYEIQYQFYKRDQLMWSVVRHYSEQFLKQMYVLVLGLDVLGNPFGLIRGLSEGVEALFYEPFQGAVQGPEEFAEGLVIGVRSLFGHTVGGAAGVVSRITGSVGKGLAAITMDKEYQQKRREEMGRQPKDFGDSLAKGGKGFLRGVVGGVTGIITKPMEGAKKEGAAGFFKGIGKGLVGAVARPTGGIIDMASSTFQGIQRAAESTEDVSSLRPPRLIHEDGIIRPYDRSESEGHDLFENHIKKLDGETYRYHCAIPTCKKANLVVTNRRVLFVKEVEILGHMSVEWQHPFEDFVLPPSVDKNLLKISVKDHGLFHKKDNVNQVCLRKVYLQNPTIAMRACNAIDNAQSTRHQQKLVKQSSLKLVKQ